MQDRFFDLGGDSIGSIRLAARARAGGLILSPQDVFSQQTVAALARVARPGAAVGPPDRQSLADRRNTALAPDELAALEAEWEQLA